MHLGRAFEVKFVIVFIMVLRRSRCDVMFSKAPANVDAITHSSPVFSCEIKNMDTGLGLQWMKDGVILAKEEFTNTKYETQKLPISYGCLYTLKIKNVIESDGGDYFCEIHDKTNTLVLRSDSTHLTVLQTPDDEYPECQPTKNYYLLDSKVELTCISQVVNPPITLTLWNQGIHIVNGLKTESKNGLVYSSYTFTATKEHISRIFICNQTSSIHEINPVTCSFESLDIYYKPEISIEHTNEIIAGTDSIIFCKDVSNPPVIKYTWTFSSQLTENEYEPDGQVLRLIKISIERNGLKITCTAENKAGISTETTALHVIKEENVDYFDKDPNNILNSQYDNEYKDDGKDDDDKVSLSVVIVVIIVIVVILVIVILIPVYYHCICKKDASIPVDASGREMYQPTVYYDTRDRASNSGLYDRSLPRLPSTGHYGHWRQSFASQVPEDLTQEGYMYVEERNGQNTL